MVATPPASAQLSYLQSLCTYRVVLGEGERERMREGGRGEKDSSSGCTCIHVYVCTHNYVQYCCEYTMNKDVVEGLRYTHTHTQTQTHTGQEEKTYQRGI